MMKSRPACMGGWPLLGEKTLFVAVNMSGRKQKAAESLAFPECFPMHSAGTGTGMGMARHGPAAPPAPRGLTPSHPARLPWPPAGCRFFVWQTKGIPQETTISFTRQTSCCFTNRAVPT